MSRFAAGGDSARDAFFEVVNALEGMDDPMSKNTAAVALFGTMYEDLESMSCRYSPAWKAAPWMSTMPSPKSTR